MQVQGGRGECRRCESFLGGCSIHYRRMEKELAKYFRLHSYTDQLGLNDDTDWESMDDRALLEIILASHMAGFCGDYGALRGGEEEGGQQVILRHGRLDVTFDADALRYDDDDGSDEECTQGDRYEILPSTGGTFFTMGVIFDYAPPQSPDFCCLFEDGTYFLCDTIKTAAGEEDSPEEKESFALKLLHMKELIEKATTTTTAAA